MSFNIAIDGPAGAGKSTIAKALAKKLGFIYVDTGAMYRAIALHMLKNDVDIKNPDEVSKNCENVDVSISYENGEQQVLLNGENVNAFIRTEEVSHAASVTSAYKAVRAKLLELQQGLAAKCDVIMDGRDIGTCVLPNADLKIYLTASVDARAKRRYDEYIAKGMECDLEEIKKEIAERDYRDMNREEAPLKQAEDAVMLDSSDMGIEEVIGAMMDLYENKVKN